MDPFTQFVKRSRRGQLPVSRPRLEATPKPERSKTFKAFEEYFTKNPLDNSTFVSLEKLDLTERIQVRERQAYGGFADVYDGLLEERPNQRPIKIAVKVFRTYAQRDRSSDGLGSIAREFRIWEKLEHRNILQCVGFMEYNGLPALVSKWMLNGDLIQFLTKNVNADRLEMAKGIAYGVEYLHKNGIVHSDLKGSNILVDYEGEPLLCDFGISRLVIDGSTVTGTKFFRFSVHHLAVELIDQTDTSLSDESGQFHTMKSDIWAMGMVFYELLTLKKPFHGCNEPAILNLIYKGQRPAKPTNEECPSDDLDKIWGVCTRCWKKNPDDRPTAAKIARVLGINVDILKIQEFKAHLYFIRCVAFSPVDTKALATSSTDSEVCLWTLSEDGKTSTLRHKLSGHTFFVKSFVWSSDGLFLVSGSSDNSVRKWNISTGECELIIETPSRVYAVALSPDNKHVVSGHAFGYIYVWDVSTGDRVLSPLKGHRGFISTVVYSPDGRRILSGSGDKSIIVWDSTTGEILFGPLTAHFGDIRSISFHPSGKTFVTGSSDKAVIIWDANTFQPIHKILHLHGARVFSVQYSPDGRSILSVSEDGTLRVSDAKKDRLAVNSVENGCHIYAATFSLDGRWVAGGGYGMVQIWEVRESDP